MRTPLLLAAVSALAACQQAPDEARGASQEPASPPAQSVARNGSSESDSAEVGNPAGLVADYLARIDEGDFSAAQALFPSGGAPDILDAYAPATLDEYEVGQAAIEDAAGSINATIPLRFSLTQNMTDTAVSREGVIRLRRAKDAPGASADQRRWRFESADLSPAG